MTGILRRSSYKVAGLNYVRIEYREKDWNNVVTIYSVSDDDNLQLRCSRTNTAQRPTER
jgi:hypothetical protein